MRMLLVLVAALASMAATVPQANAFSGFFVSRSDERLFNRVSRVVVAHDGSTTTITIAQDYRGVPDDFAIVVPVPVVITEDQVTTRSSELIDRIDAYTAPRLTEYNEPNACQLEFAAPPVARKGKNAVDALGVIPEAHYAAAAYDIAVLSADESAEIVTWLKNNGYRLPPGAAKVLGSYIDAGMKFFVASVALFASANDAYVFLPPLQVRFRSDAFVLPIRLATLNASGPQELLIYMLTRRGRVHVSNYKNREFPDNQALPSFVLEEIGAFYRSMVKRTVIQRLKPAVYTEYAWEMNACAPCSASPLSRNELDQLGAGWMLSEASRDAEPGTYVTRMHLRYEEEDFPEDLKFVETDDQSRHQTRYIITHQAPEDASCPPDEDFQTERDAGRLREAKNLARLTGWPLSDILNRMGLLR